MPQHAPLLSAAEIRSYHTSYDGWLLLRRDVVPNLHNPRATHLLREVLQAYRLLFRSQRMERTPENSRALREFVVEITGRELELMGLIQNPRVAAAAAAPAA